MIDTPKDTAVADTGHSLTPTRRTVLGAGAVVAAALAARPTAAVAAKAPEPRDITFRAWRGSELAVGTHEGTTATAAGLTLGAPTTTRDYTDPFGSGAAATYDVGTWTSPVVSPGHDVTELVSSWNADTPDGTWVEVQVRGTAEDGVTTGWYVLGRWASHDPEDGGRCTAPRSAGRAPTWPRSTPTRWPRWTSTCCWTGSSACSSCAPPVRRPLPRSDWSAPWAPGSPTPRRSP